ncbi:MAG: insulinase family protein [Leptospira sp.]|nr:insulinase family protein [Leptospira sp.]
MMTKTISFKYFTFLAVFVILNSNLISQSEESKRPMGKFVADVNVEPIEISIPFIRRDKLLDRGEFLSMGESFFPLTNIELHFYAGEFPDIAPEVSSLLFGAWKLGGTKSLKDSEFIRRLDYLGAKLQWKSDYEKSILSISYMQKDEKEILTLLKEWLQDPILTEKNLNITKGQLREKLLRRNDSVASLGMRKAKERSYAGHLRSRTESIASLEKVGMQDLKNLHKRIMGSGKVNATVTGAKSLPELQKEISDIIADFQVYKNLPYSDIDFSPWSKKFRETKPDVLLVNKETNQSMVIFTGAMPPHNHPDFFAIQLLNYILGGGGFNSYFMTEIRNNRGLAYSTTSHIQFLDTHGLFLAYSLTKNESVPEVVSLMEELLDYKTVDKIREDELTRAKNAIINQFVFLFENQNTILSNQIRFDDHNMPKDYLQKYRKSIQSVQLKDLKRVGNTYFQPKNLRITIAGPKELSQSLKKLNKNVRLVEAEDNVLE